jgi:hypothetical protein
LKGKRAHLRSPALFKRMLWRSAETTVKDAEGEYKAPKFYFEEERFALIMERIGKALYYKHFKEKYHGFINAYTEYTGFDVVFGGSGGAGYALEMIKAQNEYKAKIKEEFKWEKEYGENKDVFSYSVIIINKLVKIRLSFYEGARILLVFGEDGFSWLNPLTKVLIYKNSKYDLILHQILHRIPSVYEVGI